MIKIGYFPNLCLYHCVQVLLFPVLSGYRSQYINDIRAKNFRCLHHRLNGSSSHVLTATSLSSGKAKNLTPHRIKTSNLTEIKFGTVNYVCETTPSAKFYANPSTGGFWVNRWNIRQNFYSHIAFFLQHNYRSDPLGDFYARWLKQRGLRQG